jgi:hypothetical protein
MAVGSYFPYYLGIGLECLGSSILLLPKSNLAPGKFTISSTCFSNYSSETLNKGQIVPSCIFHFKANSSISYNNLVSF